MARLGLQSGGMAGQSVDVPETKEKRRRWSGYVCPDCRFVFRIPGDHDGKGVVCPGCRRMLRIPAAGERLPPLVMPLKAASPDEGKSEEGASHGGRRRRKKKARQSENHAWDKAPENSHGSGRRERRQMRWMMFGGVVLFSLIVAGVVTAMLGGGKAPAPTIAGSAADSPSVDGVEAPVSAPVEKSDTVILAEAEPIIRKFMETSSLEDLLLLVRNPSVTESRMRKHYPDGTVEPPGLGKFNTRSKLTRLGSVLSVNVRTSDFDERTISFFDTSEGIKIDWESWAGWSEMPWEEFLDSKPTTAKLFRVELSPVDYYNFLFSDDSKWRSYRLDSPDGNYSVFGYAERGTVLDSKLRPSPDVKKVALTLSLKFPEGAGSGKQVIIDKIMTEGWVVESEEAP